MADKLELYKQAKEYDKGEGVYLPVLKLTELFHEKHPTGCLEIGVPVRLSAPEISNEIWSSTVKVYRDAADLQPAIVYSAKRSLEEISTITIEADTNSGQNYNNPYALCQLAALSGALKYLGVGLTIADEEKAKAYIAEEKTKKAQAEAKAIEEERKANQLTAQKKKEEQEKIKAENKAKAQELASKETIEEVPEEVLIPEENLDEMPLEDAKNFKIMGFSKIEDGISIYELKTSKDKTLQNAYTYLTLEAALKKAMAENNENHIQACIAAKTLKKHLG